MKKISIYLILIYIFTLFGASGCNVGDFMDTEGLGNISAKEITSYSFESLPSYGVITGTDIAATVPFGTPVTSLAASFKTTGRSVLVGSVIQISGSTVNDFTNPVIYTVLARDDSTRDYTVTVTVEAPRYR